MSPSVWVAFGIGMLFGVVGIIVIACCEMAGEIDRQEEKERRIREYMEQSTCDGNYRAVSGEKKDEGA